MTITNTRCQHIRASSAYQRRCIVSPSLSLFQKPLSLGRVGKYRPADFTQSGFSTFQPAQLDFGSDACGNTALDPRDGKRDVLFVSLWSVEDLVVLRLPHISMRGINHDRVEWDALLC